MAKKDYASIVRKLAKQPDRSALARELIHHTPAAFPAAFAAARKSDEAQLALLPLLRRLTTKEAVPSLLALLDAERSQTSSRFLMELLGAAQDASALPILGDILLDPEAYSPRRVTAALAIGVLGDPAGLAPVKQVVTELAGDFAAKGEIDRLIAACRGTADAGPGTIAMACVRAAACLGDHSLAPLAVSMAGYVPTDADPWDLEWARKAAARALEVGVAPGMVPALALLLQGGNEFDARHAALLALSFLGTRAALDHLVAAAKDVDEPLADPAAGAVRRVAGSDPELEGSDLTAWWREHESDFKPGVCYRLGTPVHLPALFDLLDDPDWMWSVERDLRVQTGREFVYESAEQATAWWKGLKHKHEDGALYKWGHKQDLSRVS